MDSKKNQIALEQLEQVPRLTLAATELRLDPEPPRRSSSRRLSANWASALAFAPLLLFIAIGEFAPEPTGDPTAVGLAIGAVMLLAMGATAGLAMLHRVSAAVPAFGLGAFGVYGQVDCAMQSHPATGTGGFWVITAAFAALALTGAGAAASSLRQG